MCFCSVALLSSWRFRGFLSLISNTDNFLNVFNLVKLFSTLNTIDSSTLVIFNRSHLVWYSCLSGIILWTVPKHSSSDENRLFGGCDVSPVFQDISALCPPVFVGRHYVSVTSLEALRVLGLIWDRDLWAVDPRNRVQEHQWSASQRLCFIYTD